MVGPEAIQLTESEMATIQILSNIRTIVARGNNVRDAKMSNINGSDIDYDGLLGEYAFCKKYNLFLDITASPRSGSYDCVYKGKRVDVKTTRHKNGRLLCTMKSNDDVDVYVLAIIDGRSVYFPGWAYKDELRSEENIIDLGYGQGYGIAQEKLRPF